MEHDGENLKKAVENAGMKVKRFAELLGVGRNTPNNWYESPRLTLDKMTRAAEVLGVPAEQIFPRLAKKPRVAQMLHNNLAEDASRPHYGSTINAAPVDELQKCTQERAAWQNKAFEFMEKYTALLEAHNRLLQQAMEKGLPHLLIRSGSGEASFTHVSQTCATV